MKLNLILQAGLPGATETTASIAGDVITVNGIAYDLSAVPEGGEAIPEGDHPFQGSITRTGGEVVASVLWLYGDDAAQVQPANPTITVTDGPVPSPVVMKEVV